MLEQSAITCSQHCMPTSALIIQAVWSLMSQEVSPWPLASLFAVCLWIVPEVWFLRLDTPCRAKKTPVSTSDSLGLIVSQQWNRIWADFLEMLQKKISVNQILIISFRFPKFTIFTLLLRPTINNVPQCGGAHVSYPQRGQLRRLSLVRPRRQRAQKMW